MTIGFDGSRAFNKHRTGTENYAFQLLTHLAQIDTENKYIVYVRPGAEVGQGWPPNFKFQISNFKFLWTQVWLAWKTFTDDLDILFVPAHTLPLIRKPGLKTVMTIHDLGGEYLPEYHQLKQRLYLNFITHYQIKTVDRLIAVSQATKQDLVKKVGVSPNKISVIYEGVNFPAQPFRHDLLTNTLNKYDLEKRGYFLFVGTIQPRKNLERLIKAFSCQLSSDDRRLMTDSSLKLVLAGGKGWLSDEIYKLPQELGIASQVKFLGYVPDADLPYLYSGARAFLFPSLYEGFGLPILEAMYYSCPVLTANTSSLPEVAGTAAVLVDPYRVSSITAGLISLTSLKTRTALIKKGLVQVKKFSWAKAARETLNLLEQVADTA